MASGSESDGSWEEVHQDDDVCIAAKSLVHRPSVPTVALPEVHRSKRMRSADSLEEATPAEISHVMTEQAKQKWASLCESKMQTTLPQPTVVLTSLQKLAKKWKVLSSYGDPRMMGEIRADVPVLTDTEYMTLAQFANGCIRMTPKYHTHAIKFVNSYVVPGNKKYSPAAYGRDPEVLFKGRPRIYTTMSPVEMIRKMAITLADNPDMFYSCLIAMMMSPGDYGKAIRFCFDRTYVQRFIKCLLDNSWGENIWAADSKVEDLNEPPEIAESSTSGIGI